MRFFFDTEFIEDFHKPLFGKRRHFIDLISIGIVSEDGSEYFAISKEFNPKHASEWVKENVLRPIVDDYVKRHTGYARQVILDLMNGKDVVDGIRHIQHWHGKTNKQIASDIYQFVCPISQASEYAGVGSIDDGGDHYLKAHPPIFYAWYADYDWVLFCSLFGKMIELPTGFPMYCRDLKQSVDELEAKGNFPEGIRNLPDYPKNEKEHDALFDAKFTKDIYNFLQTLEG